MGGVAVVMLVMALVVMAVVVVVAVMCVQVIGSISKKDECLAFSSMQCSGYLSRVPSGPCSRPHQSVSKCVRAKMT